MTRAPAACVLCLAASLSLVACSKKFDPAKGAPAQPQVIESGNADTVAVDHPQDFPLAVAARVEAPNQLSVTGSVTPDINREIPVVSLASGRVVDIRATLDENVHKGQLLLRVQSPDITNAFDAYLKAVNDELLARKALQRAQDLYAHGAIAESMLEQAQDAEADAKADLNAANQQLNTLGVDKNHPSDIVNVYAPISGVIVAQNVTNAAATGVTYAGTPVAFTIADLSHVWVLCDVFENNLSQVRVGQEARISVSGYPGLTLTGRVSDIGPVLDPTLRTAKVRIDVANPGMLRLGMFVTANLTGRTKEVHASVPADAILHLHDQDWVFVPAGQNHFRRIAVQAGNILPGNQQEILSGIAPGQEVVRSVLQLEATLEAQ
ncbi:MAG TPA: efflux RND transporter periplasmic adaptor subunit [Acidobacteriaceae bacterium]|nr:efflux RND transporter periplasmic adaptor subunit [Acidobacteriaceae bacterium]